MDVGSKSNEHFNIFDLIDENCTEYDRIRCTKLLWLVAVVDVSSLFYQ